MTLQDKVEVRRPSVGTKVLIVGLAVLAVLGSFWTIVWFIRSYVEAPRIGIPALALASRESTPVPTPPARPAPMGKSDTQPVDSGPPAPAQTAAESSPAAAPAAAPAPADAPPASAAVADRWLPMMQVTPPAADPPASPPPTAAAPAALATTTPDNDPPIEEVAEGSVPAIAGRAPLPRRKPIQTAAVRSRTDPPLPRPRPDGPAPQSVWTAAPVTDDRFPQ